MLNIHIRSIAALTLLAYLTLASCVPSELPWPFVERIPVALRVAKLREPSWSPDGNSIAVASEEASDQSFGHIYIVKVDTGEYRSYSNQFWNLEPHWSPDGLALSYSYQCTEISIVDETDQEIGHQLLGCSAVWSSDGTQLVVYSQALTDSERSMVMLFDAQTGKALGELFSTDQPQKFGGLAWSKTTNRIAFSFGVLDSQQSILTNRDIVVINPDDGLASTLVDTSADEFDPSWSPDGKWLVFLSENWQIGSNENDVSHTVTIVFAKADGSCVIPTLSADQLTGIDWSPLGETLAVTYQNQLYVVDIVKTFGEEYKDLDKLCEVDH